ncbi:MAG: leucyl aminopeptidase family protein [Pseudomonadota bacterium]
MTKLTFAAPTGDAIPLWLLDPDTVEAWIDGLPETSRGWVTAHGFAGKLGERLALPGPDGGLGGVAIGMGTSQARSRGRFALAAHRAALPKGTYRLDVHADGLDLSQEALGWLLAGYRFDRYATASAPEAQLVAPEGTDAARLETIAAGASLTQTLINTPASDLGPEALEAAARDLAETFGASFSATVGDALIEKNFPMIHAVGRASDRAPRLLDMGWGNPAHPKVTIVGKGVCFDTGGLNLKPGSSMGLMKKDMGGAAHALGLAHMIMAQNLPVRLRVLVPAVENSVSAGAFRPQDILTSRKGLTVEVNNTDAEGRLVLADALALADEEAPALMLCLATLTGAARVALGPDLPPFFTDDETLARDIGRAAHAAADPLWRMPLWQPYEKMIEPGIADLDNAPAGGAGAITAALFLRRFVERAESFAHFDLYGWTPSPLPARPKGGACQGIRALFEVVETRFGSAP